MALNQFKVPIVKAGATAFIDVDVSTYSDEAYAYVMAEGLKAIANARMSKVGAVTKLTGKELEDAQALALKIAEENLDKLAKGDIKLKSAKASKSDIPRDVQTEALRLARDVVRNEIRKAGGKISQYAAKDITAAAHAVIAGDPSYLDKARANLESRANLTSAIDVSSMIHVDPKKAAKAAEAKASKPLSATQAGKVAPRKKPAVTLAQPVPQHVHQPHGTVN